MQPSRTNPQALWLDQQTRPRRGLIMEDQYGNKVELTEIHKKRMMANKAAVMELLTLYMNGSDNSQELYRESRSMFQDRLFELFREVLNEDEDSAEPELLGVFGNLISITGSLLEAVAAVHNTAFHDGDGEMTSEALLTQIAAVILSDNDFS